MLIEFLWGGGILVITFAILSNLNAIELKDACKENSGNCEIKQPYTTITNTGFFTLGHHSNPSILVDGASTIDNFINYGEIDNHITLSGNINHLINYGTMEGISVPVQSHITHIVTIENYGAINPFYEDNHHFWRVTLRLQTYAMKINESASKFNGFDGKAEDNSHLVLKDSQVSFADKNAKLILDFGSKFELGKGYSLEKLVVDDKGTSQISVDLSHLTTKSSLYKLTQSGGNFIVSLDAPNSEIGILHKSNIRTMNNFWILSNSMIYPHKRVSANRASKKKRMIRRVKKVSSLRESQRDRSNPPHNSSLRDESSVLFSSLRVLAERQGEAIHKSLDSIESIQSLESHESFAYKNNPSDSTNRRRISSNQTKNRQMSQAIPNAIQSTKNNNYYFILTPFVNHNLFFESGRYNLSGFDGGFLTAFSGKLTPNNSLGAHFMMSYGSLGDLSDKNFHISNLNLNLGLNYKLDLVFDMYLKARGDFFYFLNQVKTLTMREAIKPNNLGFGVSVAYGKDFDFKQGGILGIEGGIDYKALSASEITLDLMSETYAKSLYHLFYLDLGISYAKYFGGFGINANLGIKGNVTANKLAKSKISLKNFNQSVDMILDNDKILGYANLALSYVLNHKNFDMEFSLAYYGNFGDRVISNGGGVEWRVRW